MTEHVRTLARIGPAPLTGNTLETVLVSGDLSSLTIGQRLEYYQATCASLGLNPLTRPFAYLRLNNTLQLYATRNCTDQLRNVHSISLEVVSRETLDDLYIVTVRAKTPDGRHDENIGAVPIGNIKGEAKANAIMKAHTKASRRATLSICGLSMPDESEIESIPQSSPVMSFDTTNTPPVPLSSEAVHPTPDQLQSLRELMQSAGIAPEGLGTELKQFFGWPDTFRLTQKNIVATLNMVDYERAWMHYAERLRAQIEDDVPVDFPPPGATTPPDEGGRDGGTGEVVPQGESTPAAPTSDVEPNPIPVNFRSAEPPMPETDADGEVTPHYMSLLDRKADMFGTNLKLLGLRKGRPVLMAEEWREIWREIHRREDA